MQIAQIFIQNKPFLELVYFLIISLLCWYISLKTDRYFRLSSHSGLRYFRNAFFFYGLAFFSKLIFFNDFKSLNLVFISQFIFEYFIIMGSLFLLYSLVWKNIIPLKEKFSSIFNSKLLSFHLIAILFALIDCFLRRYLLLFISQITIFLVCLVLIIMTYKKKKDKPGFLKFYSLAIAVGLIAWGLNFITAFLFKWDLFLLINVGLLNIIFFLVILIGIWKITNSGLK